MRNRIMVKVSETDKFFSFHTVSREYGTSNLFVIDKKDLQDLKTSGSLIVSYIHAFAKLSLLKNKEGEDVLEIHFSWIKNNFGDTLSGRYETVRLPYKPFVESATDKTGMTNREWNVLSKIEKNTPQIEFKSRKNLKLVVENPVLKRRLRKFITSHLNWPLSQRILITDDGDPYSFEFTEYTRHGRGVCGGIILHDSTDLKKAYYGIHT